MWHLTVLSVFQRHNCICQVIIWTPEGPISYASESLIIIFLPLHNCYMYMFWMAIKCFWIELRLSYHFVRIPLPVRRHVSMWDKKTSRLPAMSIFLCPVLHIHSHNDVLQNSRNYSYGIFFYLRPSSSKNGSVCLSVCLLHLFHYVPIMVSSWHFQDLLPLIKVMSMQKVKVTEVKTPFSCFRTIIPVWIRIWWCNDA